MVEVNSVPFYTSLRYARTAQGIKQSEVAERAGCSQGMVSKIESGILPPSLDMLKSVAAVMGLKVRIVLE